GDLVTTACSEESRNHLFGKMLGRGKNLREIEKNFVMVAEGVPTAKAVMKLAKKYNVEMPISMVVYEIIYKRKPPLQGLKNLMLRPLKIE
ncbi:MAG: glycerol-3-phosphate dehydrogenase, partial [candidate division WOR-3 bacterium]|nr:glycerol-3-phosphate dehydrogenase [candidate division WOR-3 bacterium]